MQDFIKKRFRKYAFSFYYPVVMGLPLSFVADFFEEFLFNDWIYLKFLVSLIVIDTILSWVYHFIKRDLSSKGFSMIGLKLLVYFSLLIMANIASSFTVRGSVVEGFGWFYTLVCTSLIIREAMSIAENAAKINPTLVPKWIRKYLSDFDENGFAKRPGENKKQSENQ